MRTSEQRVVARTTHGVASRSQWTRGRSSPDPLAMPLDHVAGRGVELVHPTSGGLASYRRRHEPKETSRPARPRISPPASPPTPAPLKSARPVVPGHGLDVSVHRHGPPTPRASRSAGASRRAATARASACVWAPACRPACLPACLPAGPLAHRAGRPVRLAPRPARARWPACAAAREGRRPAGFGGPPVTSTALRRVRNYRVPLLTIIHSYR